MRGGAAAATGVSAEATLSAPSRPVPCTATLRSVTSMPANRIAAIAFKFRGWSRS